MLNYASIKDKCKSGPGKINNSMSMECQNLKATETKCIAGFTFAPNGAQIIDQNGGGVPCQ